MSLYNMIMGHNPYSPYLMAILGFVKDAPQNAWLGRFRDIYTNDNADRIFILHRNYPENNEFNQAIKSHPNFVAYIPEPTDYTYGIWEFTIPEQYLPIVKAIASLRDNTPAMDCYRKLIEDISKGTNNEATQNAMQVAKNIFKPILDGTLQDGEERIVQHGDGTIVIKSFSK